MGFLRSNPDIKKMDEEVVEVELVSTETAMETYTNGLTTHQEAVLTPEERHAEKKFRLKIDFMILPLIATIYFLAALASFPFRLVLSRRCTPRCRRWSFIRQFGSLANTSGQDRSDVGNAAVAGMDKDLNMTSSQLSYCIAFFYVASSYSNSRALFCCVS